MPEDDRRIPVTRPGASFDPYTNQPPSHIGPSSVRVPNPPGTSSYPSRPAPLAAGADPNVYNPYQPSRALSTPGISMSREQEERALANARRNPNGLEADGYYLTNERIAEGVAAARARGESYTYPTANQMGVEANNLIALQRRGFSMPVALAATDSVTYPTRTGDDGIDAAAIRAGLEAFNRTRPGTVQVGDRTVDARLYAAATAIRGSLNHDLGYQYERNPDILTQDTRSLNRAVQDIVQGRLR